MLKYKGRIGLWLLLVYAVFGCGPMNQKPAVDPSQRSMCDPQLPGASGSADPTGGEPVAFTANKNYIVSIAFAGVPGSSPPSASASPDPTASPSPTSDNNYLLRIVSSPSLAPLSPTAKVTVQQEHLSTTTDQVPIYEDPDVSRQDQWSWLATVHYGRPSKYEIHVTVTDGNLPAEERIFYVSFN